MIHLRARRLLPALLDATLPAPREAAVRAHAGRCRRCRRVLRELVASEALLEQLPATLVRGTDTSRLAALARWAAVPEPTWQARVRSAAGTAAVAVGFALLVEAGSLVHMHEPAPEPVTVAALMPESRLFPTGVR